MPHEKSWDELKERYEEDGLVLALGAGVSIGCKLPTWKELLVRLAARSFGMEGELLCQQLIDSGYTFPAIASILEAKSPSVSDFSQLIREELYREFPFFRKGITEKNREEFLKFVKKNNPTLKTVASFCAQWNDQKGAYTPNPFIHAIANFNLDAVLQAYVRARYQTRLLRTIERPSAGSKQGRMNVYHMHGYFRFNEEDFWDLEKRLRMSAFSQSKNILTFSISLTVYSITRFSIFFASGVVSSSECL